MRQQIKSIEEFYKLIDALKSACRENNEMEILQKIDGALSLGSSVLEMLGATRQVLIENRKRVDQLLTKDDVDRIILFVDKAFGR